MLNLISILQIQCHLLQMKATNEKPVTEFQSCSLVKCDLPYFSSIFQMCMIFQYFLFLTILLQHGINTDFGDY